ncbi:MAG: acyl-CoA desaturase [Bdellovibrionia bacterium]
MSAITFDENSSEFGKVLRKRVNHYLKENNLQHTANWSSKLQMVALFLTNFLVYGLLVFGHHSTLVNVFLCIMQGLLIASVGFNILHETVHSNISKNPKIANSLRYAWEIMGACNKFYNFRHVVIHHSFTNIPGTDADIETGGVLRFAPTQEYKPHHRFQHLYGFFLYMLVTLDWVWHGDYETLKTQKVGSNKMPPLSTRDIRLFYFFKLNHAVLALAIPTFFHPFLSVLGSYILVQAVAGFVLGVVFSLAHVYYNAAFPAANEKNNQIAEGWAAHQVKTTKNFANSNRFLSRYLGGLNYQVEHHLFPRLYNGYYPIIKPIVMQTCKEFGLEYQEFKTVREAVVSHYHHLYQMGHPNTVVKSDLNFDRSISDRDLFQQNLKKQTLG